jgi:adenylate kinase family enzyme
MLAAFIQEELMNKLIFIIGASGAGKTTAVKALEKVYLPNYQILYFDSIGVPSFTEMNAKYNGPEEWQRIKTAEWVKIIKETLLPKTHVILDGQTRPKFIEDACIENKISAYEVLLFDCSDEERTERLIDRGQSELADQQMMNWASYLRQESQKRAYQIINNTHLTCEETLNKLLDVLKGKIE